MTKPVFDAAGRVLSYGDAHADSTSMGAFMQPRQDAWAAMPRLPRSRTLRLVALAAALAAHGALAWVLVTEKISIVPNFFPNQVSIMIIRETAPIVPAPPPIVPTLVDPAPVVIAPPRLVIR